MNVIRVSEGATGSVASATRHLETGSGDDAGLAMARGRISVDQVRRLLEVDARVIRQDTAYPRRLATSRPRLLRRAMAVHRSLAPIQDTELLAESLAREAGLTRALRSGASALRIGYAIRYTELAAALSGGPADRRLTSGDSRS